MNIYNHSDEFLKEDNMGDKYDNIDFSKLNEFEVLAMYMLSEISERKFYELMGVKYTIESANKTKILLNSVLDDLKKFKE